MDETQIVLERHEQKINAIEKEISELKAVQSEIRSMNETLVTLEPSLSIQTSILQGTSGRSRRWRVSRGHVCSRLLRQLSRRWRADWSPQS